MKEESRYAED